MRKPALLIALLPAFAAFAQSPCPPLDKKCAIEAVKSMPVKQAAFWKAAMAKPMDQRIGPAPRELIDLLVLDNVAHGYPNKPARPKEDDRFIAEVKRVYAEIPEALRRKVEPKLAGIYLADDIGGSGFGDEVNDPTGRNPLGFIVLDATILRQRKANAWATWKDNTPFAADKAWSLTTRIEDGARDSTAYAIQYILLHELGHILSIGEKVHPSWTLEPGSVGSTRDFAFFNLSWYIAGNAYKPLPDLDFPQRSKTAFYFGAKLRGDEMLETYSALERTNFATLYAATHPGDDFAEALASYVHVVMMRKPYEVRLSHGGRLVKSYGSCWEQPRCAAKRTYLERLLSEP